MLTIGRAGMQAIRFDCSRSGPDHSKKKGNRRDALARRRACLLGEAPTRLRACRGNLLPGEKLRARPANLDGTLSVSTFGGCIPNVGDTFTILNADSRSGTIATTRWSGFEGSVS